MVTGFEVHVDAAALADMERAEEAARAHVAAMGSAAGTATMAGEHAARIQSAGGTATMAGEHAPRIQSAGGKAGGKARRGRKRGIYKKRNQTAAQAAHAAKMRRYRAANRAVGAH